MWDKIIYMCVIILATYILKQLFSETPNYVKFQSKFLVFYIWSSFVALFYVALYHFLYLDQKMSKTPCKCGAQIIKHVTKLIEVKWHLRNGKILAEDKGAVIISNHQSSLDILGLFNVWHVAVKVAAIARKELFYIWPFGLAAYLAGVVFIDRNCTKDAYKQLKITSDVMVKNKTKIWIFPEGTRNKDSSKLLPFKKGAFNIAVAAQVPIIPVIISPYYFIDRKKYIFNKGHAIIQCLEPIPTKGLKIEDVPELITKVQNIMEIAYKELSKEVISALPPNYPLASQH